MEKVGRNVFNANITALKKGAAFKVDAKHIERNSFKQKSYLYLLAKSRLFTPNNITSI